MPRYSQPQAQRLGIKLHSPIPYSRSPAPQSSSLDTAMALRPGTWQWSRLTPMVTMFCTTEDPMAETVSRSALYFQMISFLIVLPWFVNCSQVLTPFQQPHLQSYGQKLFRQGHAVRPSCSSPWVQRHRHRQSVSCNWCLKFWPFQSQGRSLVHLLYSFWWWQGSWRINSVWVMLYVSGQKWRTLWMMEKLSMLW